MKILNKCRKFCCAVCTMGMDLSRPGCFCRLVCAGGTGKGTESGAADLRQTQRPPRQKECTDKEVLYSGVNGVMCYDISRRFSCCDFLGQWNFSYEYTRLHF